MALGIGLGSAQQLVLQLATDICHLAVHIDPGIGFGVAIESGPGHIGQIVIAGVATVGRQMRRQQIRRDAIDLYRQFR